MSTLFWLVVSHAVCDYPLQSDFMAKAKNHRSPIPGIDWWVVLMAHAAVHAGGVALATGHAVFGVFEFVAHCFIDYGKCQGLYGFKVDQLLHIACKMAWFAGAAWGTSI